MIKVKDNELLVEKLHEAGINLSTYCNKRGLCGKCFVEIAEGLRTRLGKREKFLLTHKGLNKDYRLACLYKIKGDLSITIPEESIIQEAFVLKTGIQIPINLNPAVKKYHLQLEKPSIVNPYSISELLESSLKVKDLNIHTIGITANSYVIL